MTLAQLIQKYESLPEELKREVELFIDNLHAQKKESLSSEQPKPEVPEHNNKGIMRHFRSM
ncbi:MAG: DUF2281 domain-containing protein [Bacteroidota bacterium]